MKTRLALALAALLVAGACSPHAFHQEWSSGRYEAAADIFRTDTTLRSDPRALWRMALLQLSPDLPLYDLGAARTNLRSVLRLEPETTLEREARLLLEVARQLDETTTRVRELESQVDELQGQVGQLEGRLGELQGRLEELQERRGELQELLRSLREQLKALKAIDLGPATADTASSP